MKQIVLISLLLSSFAAFSQELAENTKKFAVKYAPAALSLGKVSIGTEYNFKYRNSVTFYAGIPVNKGREINYMDDAGTMQSKTFSVMAGYRHYVTDKSMCGFYVEPFVKYLQYKGDAMLPYDIGNAKANFDVRSSYRGIGAGAQLGVQMIISRSIVLDLFVLGPEVNNANISFLATDVSNNVNWTDEDANDLEHDVREILNDVPLVGNRAEVDVNAASKSVSVAYKGFAPGIRVGGSVGIRF